MTAQTKEIRQVMDLADSIILARRFGDNTIAKHFRNDVSSDVDAARELFADKYKYYVPKAKIQEAFENATDLDSETIVEYSVKIQLDLMKQD